MKVCKLCGQQASNEDEYCPRCGSGQLEELETVEVDKEEKQGVENKVTLENEVKEIGDSKEDKKNKKDKKKNNKSKEKTNSEISSNTDKVDTMTTSKILRLYATFLIPIYGIYLAVKYALGGEDIKKQTTNLVRANLVVVGVVAVVVIIAVSMLGRIVVRI